MTIVEFLRARLDEDAACATAAGGERARWTLDIAPDGTYYVSPGRAANDIGNVYLRGDAEHIARHDPARVLADVEAKRRIVDLHDLIWRDVSWLEDGDEATEELPVCALDVPRHSAFQTREAVPVGGCATLRLLALPYADHPDYDSAWRP